VEVHKEREQGFINFLKMKNYLLIALTLFVMSCSISKKATDKKYIQTSIDVIKEYPDMLDFYNTYCKAVEPEVYIKTTPTGKKFIAVKYPMDSISAKDKQNWWSNTYLMEILFDTKTKKPYYIIGGASGIGRILPANPKYER